MQACVSKYKLLSVIKDLYHVEVAIAVRDECT